MRAHVLVTACGLLAGACIGDSSTEQAAATTPGGAMAIEHPLVADQRGKAPIVDPALVNAWGVAVDDEGLFWIADNGTGKITIVDRDGKPSTGEYRSDQFDLGGGIDGIVGAKDAKLKVRAHGECGGADFLVASEGGTIQAINGDLEPHTGIPFADRSSEHAIFKGVAITEVAGATRVLAADFHNARVDVFDGEGKLVSCDPAKHPMFVDPNLPAGFAPFDVVVLGDRVLVAYAMQDAEAHDEVDGPGLGAISEFDAAGAFVRRLTTGGVLNAPWAITEQRGALVVGNFGDGRITLFDETTGRPVAQLVDTTGAPLAVDGLWGIAAMGDHELFFASGPDSEAHGLFGRIDVR